MELDDSRERPGGSSPTDVSGAIASRAVPVTAYIDQNTYSGVPSVRVSRPSLLGDGGDKRAGWPGVLGRWALSFVHGTSVPYARHCTTCTQPSTHTHTRTHARHKAPILNFLPTRTGRMGKRAWVLDSIHQRAMVAAHIGERHAASILSSQPVAARSPTLLSRWLLHLNCSTCPSGGPRPVLVLYSSPLSGLFARPGHCAKDPWRPSPPSSSDFRPGVALFTPGQTTRTRIRRQMSPPVG
jgi:hypothetical protein